MSLYNEVVCVCVFRVQCWVSGDWFMQCFMAHHMIYQSVALICSTMMKVCQVPMTNSMWSYYHILRLLFVLMNQTPNVSNICSAYVPELSHTHTT